MAKEKKELTPLAEELRVIARIDSAIRHLSIDAKERVLGYVQMAVIEERVAIHKESGLGQSSNQAMIGQRLYGSEVNHG